MNSFSIVIIIMILLAALFVLIPVMRFRGIEKAEDREIRNQKNIAVFKQSTKELKTDLANNIISNEEYQKLEAELQRGFIQDMDEASAQTEKVAASANKAFPLALLPVLLIAGFLFYQNVGSGQDLVIPELLDQIQTSQDEQQQTQAITELAAALDDRFQRYSDNIQNGYTLGTIYISLEQYPDAARIFNQLAGTMEDSPDKATVLGQLAQSRYLMADSVMNPEVRAVIDQALALNPNEQAIMSLLAIDALVSLDFTGAINYWRRQLLQLDPSSSDAALVRERIANVQELIPAEELAANAELVAGASVTVSVDIDDSIRELIAEDMRVFIFARGETMPLPLAAQTFSLEELPLTITLDDSMAMTPQFTLSSAERVYVGARISRVATAQSGDFQVLSDTFVVADQIDPITLTIKDIVP